MPSGAVTPVLLLRGPIAPLRAGPSALSLFDKRSLQGEGLGIGHASESTDFKGSHCWGAGATRLLDPSSPGCV